MAEPDTNQLVTAFLDAANRRDPDALAAICVPDVEFRPLLGPPTGLPHRGADGIRRWLAEVGARFPDIEARAEHVRTVHGGIVVSGTTAGPGIGYAWHVAIRLRDGLVAGWDFHPSSDHARRALATRT